MSDSSNPRLSPQQICKHPDDLSVNIPCHHSGYDHWEQRSGREKTWRTGEQIGKEKNPRDLEAIVLRDIHKPGRLSFLFISSARNRFEWFPKACALRACIRP